MLFFSANIHAALLLASLRTIFLSSTFNYSVFFVFEPQAVIIRRPSAPSWGNHASVGERFERFGKHAEYI